MIARQDEHGDMGGWPVAPVQGLAPVDEGLEDPVRVCPVCGRARVRVGGRLALCFFHGISIEQPGGQ